MLTHGIKLQSLQVYRWPGATYEGEVLNGKRHGQGVIAFEGMPAVYEGEWADGMRHGRGTLYFNPERTAFYEGEFRGTGWLHEVRQTNWWPFLQAVEMHEFLIHRQDPPHRYCMPAVWLQGFLLIVIPQTPLWGQLDASNATVCTPSTDEGGPRGKGGIRGVSQKGARQGARNRNALLLLMFLRTNAAPLLLCKLHPQANGSTT